MQPTQAHGCKQPFAAKKSPAVVQVGDTAEVSPRTLRHYIKAVCGLSGLKGHAFARQPRLAAMLGLSDRHLRRVQVHAEELGLVRVDRNGRANHVYPLWESIKMSDLMGHGGRSTPYIDPKLKHQTGKPAVAPPPTAQPERPAARAPEAEEQAVAPLRALPRGADAIAVLRRRRLAIADMVAIAERMVAYHQAQGVHHAGRLVHSFIADQQSAHREAAELAERMRDPDYRPPDIVQRAPGRPKVLLEQRAYVPRHKSDFTDTYFGRLREVGCL